MTCYKVILTTHYFTHEHNSHPRKYNPKTAEQIIATLRGKGKPNTDLEWRHLRDFQTKDTDW